MQLYTVLHKQRSVEHPSRTAADTTTQLTKRHYTSNPSLVSFGTFWSGPRTPHTAWSARTAGRVVAVLGLGFGATSAHELPEAQGFHQRVNPNTASGRESGLGTSQRGGGCFDVFLDELAGKCLGQPSTWGIEKTLCLLQYLEIMLSLFLLLSFSQVLGSLHTRTLKLAGFHAWSLVVKTWQ